MVLQVVQGSPPSSVVSILLLSPTNSKTNTKSKFNRVKALYTSEADHKKDNMASSAAAAAATAASSPKWAQKTITLPPLRRGCHLITPKIVKEIGQDLSQFNVGLAHLFLHHTSASLTINENYDSDVRADTETFLNSIVPEGASAPWKHTLEGPDDMPAHIKSSMFGCALTIPITNGKLNMGTWQLNFIKKATKQPKRLQIRNTRTQSNRQPKQPKQTPARKQERKERSS